MSDLHKSDPSSPYADDLEFVRDYAERNAGYALVQPVVDFINAHPAPQIIRTVEELEALDPDTILTDCDGWIQSADNTEDWWETFLPLVVITPGPQVRAAREALEEA